MLARIKSIGRCVLSLYGFMYDWIRYVNNNGWKKNLHDKSFRNYYIVKVYHTLEKSMSYKEKRKGAAYSNALLLLDILNHVDKSNPGFHDKIAAEVLRNFCQSEVNRDDKRFNEIEQKIPPLSPSSITSGTKIINKEDFFRGKLNSPEDFFNSRYSLREYSEEPVPQEVILRALSLAQKTPSSCNMQGWHTYIISNPEKLQKALELQSGNRGFGHKVRGLLILTFDQTPFISSSERYQHWIDGGLHSMSIVYALHSLGVASCCLNWSEDPKRDILLRKELNIKNQHSILMMLSFGYPENINNVCASPRRPINESITVVK
ncbi:nitroreductase family protein [Providencia alcalifaciens]|uniref:nitroreductase family protein n=1 Tax=Providencia alcalifaciens TaxID=126385 RepID=UPI000D84A824|nr:nitroreductase family protein [Providencia alcalifaciens]MTC26108.1 nitroreductase [Providencia alcalifaciens]SPY70817.1 5,6-dimethylbenzimidazole synthase [Providencia alcalifaciens]